VDLQCDLLGEATTRNTCRGSGLAMGSHTLLRVVESWSGRADQLKWNPGRKFSGKDGTVREIR